MKLNKLCSIVLYSYKYLFILLIRIELLLRNISFEIQENMYKVNIEFI